MLRRFPEALRKLDQVLNITPDDLDTLAAKANIVPSSRVIFRVRRRSSLHCTQTQTTAARWKYKFTKRSWSAALHQ